MGLWNCLAMYSFKTCLVQDFPFLSSSQWHLKVWGFYECNTNILFISLQLVYKQSNYSINFRKLTLLRPSPDTGLCARKVRLLRYKWKCDECTIPSYDPRYGQPVFSPQNTRYCLFIEMLHEVINIKPISSAVTVFNISILWTF